MKQFYTLSVLFSLFLVTSCRKEYLSDNEHSPIRTVLILGNSLVFHGTNPAIGWNNNWGMAATVRDSDFVHNLIRDIQQTGSIASVQFKALGLIFQSSSPYSLSNFDSLRNPNMLICEISDASEQQFADSSFIVRYSSLIDYIDKDKKTIKVITDCFWSKPNINSRVKDYAVKNNFLFVALNDLSNDSTNLAGNRFANPGIGIHPSDKGMRIIASRIWGKISNYFY